MPLIMAGTDVPAGRLIETPVSHIDCAPTILEAVGAAPLVAQLRLRGAPLFAVANGAAPTRPVISEYHATASIAGAYMLRFGRYKYCHYVAYRPQLFDLAADPEELVDLAADPRYANALADGERLLRATLDPEAVEARQAAAGGTAGEVRWSRKGASAWRTAVHTRARHCGRDDVTSHSAVSALKDSAPVVVLSQFGRVAEH